MFSRSIFCSPVSPEQFVYGIGPETERINRDAFVCCVNHVEEIKIRWQ